MKNFVLRTLAVCAGLVIGLTIAIAISSSIAAWNGA
jgi:hypothetical protein